MFGDAFAVAFAALRANKLRSVLTMLGVIIGVTSVIVMTSIVDGIKGNVMKEFEGLGSSLIIVFFDPTRQEREAGLKIDHLTLEDSDNILAECPLVKRVSPEISMDGKLKAEGEDYSGRVVGVVPAYEQARAVTLASGRFVEEEDQSAWAKVAVLGDDVAYMLFRSRGMDPVGRDVMVSGVQFTVIGVLKAKGRGLGEDYDKSTYVPLGALHKRLIGSEVVGSVLAQAVSVDQTEAAGDQIWRSLMRHHGNRKLYTVDSMGRLTGAINRILGVIGIVLGGVAGLSLLVGGIGIMNIMLVSVTERTREIGIRKAVGARNHHILAQFLTESATLSGVGGLIGIALGWGVSWVVGHFAGDQLPTRVLPWSVITAVTFSIGVGVFFGIYPAYRAARLDPITALRYE
ncbi:MAG TPA: ABC transporter permease [Armatimonadota bacterium]|jgi:putative ABC transport system permease protein